MSLHNFQLPHFLTAELYKNSLVELDIENAEIKAEKENDLIFLGKNEKNVLIIVNTETALYLPDDELHFLTGILSACKMSLRDTALINIDKNPGISYRKLLLRFKPETVICLGVDLVLLEFPLEFPNYQVQKYSKQSYLSAPSLKMLSADKAEKSQLWLCLKKIFSV